MNQTPPTRGRPRTITHERIANAGIAVGLPEITMVGIAAKLGVSHMALYKHVPSLGALKQLVAEEIFLRWSLPQPQDGERLEEYLSTFSVFMWRFVGKHPGIAPYLLREDLITPAMMAKIEEHQKKFARTHGISFAQSQWLFFTVAYHCIAVADTVLPSGNSDNAQHSENLTGDKGSIDTDYSLGIRALIIGALSVLDEV